MPNEIDFLTLVDNFLRAKPYLMAAYVSCLLLSGALLRYCSRICGRMNSKISRNADRRYKHYQKPYATPY